MKAKKDTTCGTCHGLGQDKNSRTAVKFVPYTDDEGKLRRRHVTLQQGSGCITCGGTGRKDSDGSH